MKLFTHSRLFGILIVAASLPMDPGVALAASSVAASLEPTAPAGSLEARLQRIAAAVRAGQASSIGAEASSFVEIAPGGVGWRNGRWGKCGCAKAGLPPGSLHNGRVDHGVLP